MDPVSSISTPSNPFKNVDFPEEIVPIVGINKLISIYKFIHKTLIYTIFRFLTNFYILN